MKPKTRKTKIVTAAIFSAFAVFFFVSENFIDRPEKRDPTSEAQVMEKDLYQNDGLGEGLTLSDEILYSDDSVIIYSDRLLRRFSYKDESIENIADYVKAMKKACRETVDFYVLPVPLRISVNEDCDDEEKLCDEFFSKLRNTLEGEATLVDVKSDLKAHGGEYIFFRTEDTWTARGAYYGSRALCGALGKTPYELEDYEEYMYNSFFGNLWTEYHHDENLGAIGSDEIELINNDCLYYYRLPGDKNRKAVFKNEKWIKMPTFTPSARGTSTFTGGDCQETVIEGEGDGAILLICDDDGAVLAPYMAGYYDRVYVVNIKKYKSFANDFNDIVSQNEIKSVVWVQSAFEMGDSGFCGALNGF